MRFSTAVFSALAYTHFAGWCRGHASSLGPHIETPLRALWNTRRTFTTAVPRRPPTLWCITTEFVVWISPRSNSEISLSI